MSVNSKVGNITYYDSSGQDAFIKPYSEETAKTIDLEISKMIEEQYNRAITILKKHKQKLNTLANLLLEKEVIFKDDLLKVFGERPFVKKEEESTNKEVIEENS